MEEQYNDFNESHIKERWRNYINAVNNVHPLVVEAIKICNDKNIPIKTALDIGCGPGNESNFLVSKKIKTTAIDYNAECLHKINENFPFLLQNKLFEFKKSRVKDLEWTNYDCFTLLKVLPFLAYDVQMKTLKKIKSSLNTNGIFIASFFGTDDDWQELELISSKKVKSIFSNFKELYFKETKTKKKAVSGEIKNAHIIDVIYQKV